MSERIPLTDLEIARQATIRPIGEVAAAAEINATR